MRKDTDMDYGREEWELDPRRMAFLMGLMLILLVIPFALHVVGVIETWLMTLLFIPGIAILAYMVIQSRKK